MTTDNMKRKSLVKFGRVVLKICVQTDRQTDNLIAILRRYTGRSSNPKERYRGVTRTKIEQATDR